MIGLGASISHLGRPLGAWRAFLGLRKSWLSREIVVFGALPPLAGTAAFGTWLGLPSRLILAAYAGTLVVGLLGVFCSAMIYIDTQRDFWRGSRTFTRFFGTVATAAAFTWLVGTASYAAALATVLGCGGLLAWDWLATQRELRSPQLTRRQSARIQTERLPTWVSRRYRLGVAALIGASLVPLLGPFAALAGALAMLASELCSRLLYFKAVDAPKMPGGLAR